MAEKVRLGVVGLRNIGQGHVASAQKLPDAEIVAFADSDPNRLRDACAKSGSARTFANAQQLFEDKDVEAVVLAVPNHLHASMAIAALNAGKHVLVEKPMSRNAAEARDMLAARDRSGKVLMVGMNQRFRPEHHALRELIRNGELGDIYYGRTRWCMQRPGEGLWTRGDWFLSAEKSGGGAVLDMGVHRLDLALHLMGFPRVKSVNAATFCRLANIEMAQRGKGVMHVDEAGVALIHFTNDAALILEASYYLNAPRHNEQYTLLCGTKGYAEAAKQVCAFAVDKDERALALPPVTGASSCVEHFVRVIRGEEKLSPTGEQALASMDILDAIFESARTGQTVQLETAEACT
jgi:predicted dehydrogenase